MNAESPICPICSKPRNPDASSPDGHCQGHARPNIGSTSKQRLDAIKSANAPQSGPSLKDQLDAIPGPGWAAPPASGVSLKEQLDAIPGPGSGSTGGASIKDQLDAIPSPGASLKDQLDAIPSPSADAGMKGQLDSIPTPSGAKSAPSGGGLIGRKKTATADVSSLKGGAARQEPASAPAAGISKSALDSIPTPGTGAAANFSKDALDSIPAPGGGAARVSKTALDAIPSPGSGAGISKESLDSIPTPGAGGGFSKDALDAIPAPGGGRTEVPASPSGQSLTDQLDSIPTPRAAGGPGAGGHGGRSDGEVPEWMRNFEKHQSSISPTQTRPSGGYSHGGDQHAAPDAVPDSYRSPIQRGTGETAPPESSPYTTIIGVVILVCIVVVGIMMYVKPTANLSTTPSSSSTPAPSSAPPAPSGSQAPAGPTAPLSSP